jgi:hypothetical protein
VTDAHKGEAYLFAREQRSAGKLFNAWLEGNEKHATDSSEEDKLKLWSVSSGFDQVTLRRANVLPSAK